VLAAGAATPSWFWLALATLAGAMSARPSSTRTRPPRTKRLNRFIWFLLLKYFWLTGVAQKVTATQGGWDGWYL
jgi:hypothetical protein